MTSHRVFLIALALFAGSVVFSLAGATLLNFFPGPAASALGVIADVTGLTLQDLIKIPTWVNMAMLPVLAFALYLPELGWGRSLAFLAVGCVVGAAAELIGTQTGFPFGPYSYGDFLGAKIAGHVPWLIPPSWYAISIVSLDLGRRLGLGRAGRVGAVALFMVLWDVALDPAMNHAFPFWKYDVGGVFFGMPLVNWAGWALTSAVIAVGYEALGGLRAAPGPFEAVWAPRFYAVNSLFSVGVCFAYKAPAAGLAGLVGLAIALGVLWLRRDAAPPVSGPAGSRAARPAVA
ncbi:carotenoid biosynthesis protein [Rubrivirga sp. S365]|uniref:Carotenoid biosynthesis protein n=1 Tax=Rubrivirga litoralis TaxID=3075598 RepID=A0ABU3BVH5_9BACT|nr:MULTISPECIES: bisanhydrobacterioruberin hydratase CruF [unclassified Rubrivirga]MDT0633287.1 carotenoid biosynthesis protein [Rubrivirga sp. F394]MDT7857614.1 carotenoid biosynthesis protein [Rubrivirga sp. S365]